MISQRKLNDGSIAKFSQQITPQDFYGFGLWATEVRGHQAIEHGGSIHGFFSWSVYLADLDIHVAMLCNSNPPYSGNPHSFESNRSIGGRQSISTDRSSGGGPRCVEESDRNLQRKLDAK